MTRDLKIHVDPQDIRVPEEGDFRAQELIDELITTALTSGSGGQAFGLLVAAMGTFADLAEHPIQLLECAISCLTTDLEEQKSKHVVELLGRLPQRDPPDGWQDLVHAAADEIDKERNKKP